MGSADVQKVGDVVACRGLWRGRAYLPGETAENRDAPLARHSFDFLRAAIRGRPSVAEHHFQLGAAKRFYPAIVVDRLERRFRAHATQRPIEGEGASHRL